MLATRCRGKPTAKEGGGTSGDKEEATVAGWEASVRLDKPWSPLTIMEKFTAEEFVRREHADISTAYKLDGSTAG